MANLEKTNVQLASVLISIPVLVGGLFWLFTIESKADKALELGQSVKLEAIDDRRILKEVRDSQIRMEEQLKRRK